MSKQYYDRYNSFKFGNDNKCLPYTSVLSQPTDLFIQYNMRSRLDIVSQTYYGTPYYGWLILQANPGFSLEFDIPNGYSIRVPFPLNTALMDYGRKIEAYNNLYKINS